MEENKLAYLAGIIDGEGCITINIHRIKGEMNGLLCRLIINNTNEHLINFCKNAFIELGVDEKRIKMYTRGGGIYKNTKRKKCWIIMINQMSSILIILSQIEKFLLVKKEQAKLIIEYIKNMDTYSNKMELYERMKILNDWRLE